MLRSMLRNLSRSLTSTHPRPARAVSHRATLAVEGMEDRMVPAALASLTSATSVVSTAVLYTQPPTTTASQNGSTLNISTAAGQITYIKSDGAGHIDVDAIDEQGQFNISSINSVVITGQGNSNVSVVDIDDSNGLPFASGTTISLYGSSSTPQNLVNLYGSRTLNTSETYVPGSIERVSGPNFSVIIDKPATLSLNNLGVTFSISSSFGGGINDGLPITGTFDVQTSGTQVSLNSYGPGSGQYFSGLGTAAGSGVGFANKPSVVLDEFAANASVFLDAADAAPGESYFTVNMNGAGDTTTLDQTPKGVLTIVNVDQPATSANVAVWGNFGPVLIDGDSSTGVTIGYPLSSTGTITSGIEANVTVEGASYLIVNDSGNTSTFENVTVTDHTISGSGLFGNSGVTLDYSGIEGGGVYILTGQLANGYTIAPSSPNAQFTTPITIDDITSTAFHVNVDVNSFSHLNLTLFNGRTQNDAVLDVNGNGGSVELPGGANGTVDVLFGGQATSQISYNGFTTVV